MKALPNKKLAILMLVLLALLATDAFAAKPPSDLDVTVTGALPAEAEQGATKRIRISGTNFEPGSQVKFFVTETKDSSQIVVIGEAIYVDDEHLDVDIEVALLAPAVGYDIEVQAAKGRRGKGTTLFAVTRANRDEVTCAEAFSPSPTTCDCRFKVSTSTPNILGLVDNCKTSETLWLTDYRITSTDSQQSRTIRAVNDPSDGTFHGSTVFANTRHRTMVRFIDFEFAPDVKRGCEVTDDIHSAISLVLHDEIPDPRLSLSDPLKRNTFLQVWNTRIFSDDDPLCTGIEVIRTEGYTQRYSDPDDPEIAYDWKVSVVSNEIGPGSYVEAGIVFLGMMPLESINPPKVVDNTIGAPACKNKDPNADPDAANAIQFGALTPDPTRVIDGQIETNTINMASNCGGSSTVSYGTGVMVFGDTDGVQTTVNVNKNDISGALVGVEADDKVVFINFSGNKLTGDGDPSTDDIGIISNAVCTDTKGKPNKINGYFLDIDDAGCP